MRQIAPQVRSAGGHPTGETPSGETFAGEMCIWGPTFGHWMGVRTTSNLPSRGGFVHGRRDRVGSAWTSGMEPLGSIWNPLGSEASVTEQAAAARNAAASKRPPSADRWPAESFGLTALRPGHESKLLQSNICPIQLMCHECLPTSAF